MKSSRNSLWGNLRQVRFATLWLALPGTVKATGVLTAVLIMFSHPFFFQGRQFSPMDLLYRYYPWKAFAPDWYERPSNILRVDDASKYYPGRVSLVRNFKQDGITLWQTEHLLGTPNRPTLHQFGALFYPLMWLFFLLPFNTANSLIHISNLLIAGVSMWLLLREHNLSMIPALAGAVVYMLNGFFIVWMSAFFLPAMLALLPLLLLLHERLVRHQKPVFALMAALVIALQFYLGYPPGSIVFLSLYGLYCVVSLVRLCHAGDWAAALRTVGFLGLALVLAAGLSSLYLMPALEQLEGSEYMIARSHSHRDSLPWQFLLGFIFPNLWGNPTGAMGEVWTGWGNYCELIAYWGIAPVVIAVFGLLTGKKRGQLYPFAVLALVLAFSLAYGVPPLFHLRELPGVTGVNAARWHFGIVLAGSLLTASGLEWLMAVEGRQRVWAAAIGLLIGAGGGYLVATVASPETVSARFADYPRLVRSHYWQLGLAAASLVLLALRLLLPRRVSGKALGMCLLGLVVVDLFVFGSGFNPYISDEDLYPPTPGIRYLQSRPAQYRIVPWGSWTSIFPAQTANVYGIETITGHDHYRDLTYRAFLEPMMSENAELVAQRYGYLRLDQNLQPNRHLLAMLNVRYIVTVPEADSFEQLSTAYAGPDMWIYENPAALPRAWGVPRYELVTNAEALHRVHQEDFDPRDAVLLEKEPELAGEQPACDSGDLQSKVVGYAQDEVVVSVEFPCDGILVLAERFAPGWRATVDGENTDVLRANYLLRAVAVPAGQHTVHLQYRSAVYLWGLGVSLCTLVLFCGMLGFVWRRWAGAIVLAVSIPTLVVMVFGRPFKKPTPPAERWVEIGTPARSSVPSSPQTARLKDGTGEIALLGYDLDRTVLAPGDTLGLTLYWRSDSQVARDYTVFTHLVDDGGRRWAQKDKPPLGGMAPTTTWESGQVVADNYHLVVDPDAPATIARLTIGMYDWRTGERVPLFGVGGDRQVNDSLTLDTAIEVRR